MRMTFCVLQFREGVQLVPNNWLKDGRCYWPGKIENKKYIKLVKDMAPPQPDWQLCPIVEEITRTGMLFFIPKFLKIELKSKKKLFVNNSKFSFSCRNI